MDLAEQALAPLRPRELARARHGKVHLRQRPGRLAEPTEAAGSAHLRGDEVGHLVGVSRVDRGELVDLVHPLAVRYAGPRAVVEGIPGGGDGLVDVGGGRLRSLADRLFGVGEITVIF